MSELASLERYERHLLATTGWILRSVRNGRGGSCAHYSPVLGWSRPYPETTGYLIPTLLRLDRRLPGHGLCAAADDLGGWLLEIQLDGGAWAGGLHPPRGASRPSVFNTGQILKGMLALHEATSDARWLDAARRGAAWLAADVTAVGDWGHNDYRSELTPAYYSHVAWPMLAVAEVTQDRDVRDAAERVLRFVLTQRREDGSFDGWSFAHGKPAFTHTIAYTLRGLLESARILDAWEAYGKPLVPALERLARKAELRSGRLPGAYRDGWKPLSSYTCLTGNAQVALCLLLWDAHDPDLRIVNAAAKLVDQVCAVQRLGSPLSGVRGAVAGSAPLWGRYMTLRYPNWAAKYHCDALLALETRIRAAAGKP